MTIEDADDDGFFAGLMLVIAGLALAATVVQVWRIVAGVPLQTDTVSISLAAQVTDTTKTVIGLTTAVLGAVGFLFSDKVSNYWANSSSRQRRLVVVGAVLGCSSILTGLGLMWGTIYFAAEQTVVAGLNRLLILQLFQLGELALALLLIASVAVLASRRSP